MPKPKNRIMCPDCGKQKILFESESKANNFIKWNKDDIENGDKLRVYYCSACCGWHISHQKYHKDMEGRTDKMIKAYNGNCGIWFADGVWYIDKSHRVNTKKEALEVGRACNQISVLRWSGMKLAYC